MSLEDLTTRMRDNIGESSPLSATVKFDFGDDGLIRIDGTATPPVVNNDDGDADCTIKVSIDDFQNILDGNENAQMAFMMGKLKVEGDMGIAMQLGSLLG